VGNDHHAASQRADRQTVVRRMHDVGLRTSAGLREKRYRLYKVAGKQAGTYNHLLESSWPGGEVYDRIHKSAE